MASEKRISRSQRSSVEMLKAHIDELPVRNVDSGWINENKIDLDSLMKDKNAGSCFKSIFKEY